MLLMPPSERVRSGRGAEQGKVHEPGSVTVLAPGTSA